MKGHVIILCLLCFVASATTGCDKLDFLGLKKSTGKSPEPSPLPVRGTVIAKVNNMPITLTELNEEVENYNQEVKARFESVYANVEAAERPDLNELLLTTRDQKIDYLKEQLIRRALLYQEAEDRGIGRNASVQKDIERFRQDRLILGLAREEADKVNVTEGEIEQYYNEYKDQPQDPFGIGIREPEERKIRSILVPTEAEAREILIQLLQGSDFSTLARERSKAQNSSSGGDLGYITRGQLPAQFESVVFSDSLGKGNTSNIIKGEDGYYILKVEDIREGKQKSSFEVRDQIKVGLTLFKQQQAIENLVSELSRKAKLEVYESEIQ